MKPASIILKVCWLAEQNYSYRMISESAEGIGHGTIQNFLNRKEELGKSYLELKELDPSELQILFYPPKQANEESRPLPDFEVVHERVSRKTAPTTLVMEYEDYREEYKNQNPYSKSQFYILYNRWCSDNGVSPRGTSMPGERHPGEFMYMDWAGKSILLIEDPVTGELKRVYFFVTTLGQSSKIFVKAFIDMKIPSVIDGTLSALKFYGALPKALRPDNMPTIVVKHEKDYVELTAAFDTFEDYLNIPVMPTRVRSPKGKPTVENAVKWITTRIIGRLSGQTFPDLESLNEAVMKIVGDLNQKTQQKTGKSRNQLFKEKDLPEMGKLPEEPFNYVNIMVRTIPDNYHIKYGDHYYSVPHTLYSSNKKVSVIVKSSLTKIDICDMDNRLICSHELGGKDLYVTKTEHMPPNHIYERAYNDKDSTFYLDWAADVGAPMRNFIERLILRPKFPAQAYQSCKAVLFDVQKLGTRRDIANRAAAYCLDVNDITMSGYKRTLRRFAKEAGINLDKSDKRKNSYPKKSDSQNKQDDDDDKKSKKDYSRGKGYYK